MTTLELTPIWDKVFPQSDKVDHEKITFHNRYGIELAADLYKPKETNKSKAADKPQGATGEGATGKGATNEDVADKESAGGDAINETTTGKFAAIAVVGPFGAVKEQASGLYAQIMAERGFLTIAFDPSFTGESGGAPRYMASPDINTEDFLAAVDYLSCRDDVDPERIGIIGICGWGGMAVNAASWDPRIKATVASTMYNMSRVNANGYFDADDSAQARNTARKQLVEQRTADYRSGDYTRGGGVVDPLPDDAPQFVKDYHAYYKTPRGYHARSLNSNDGWNVVGCESFINTPTAAYADEIENAVMLVHGDKAHSFYFSEDTYKILEGGVNPDNKEFIVVPGASHTDLYDQVDIIPFDTIQEFFEKNLNA